jgi:hypothetical protein
MKPAAAVTGSLLALLFLTCLYTYPQAPHKKLPTLYYISMISSKDPSIGESCITDEKKVSFLFEGLTALMKFPFVDIKIRDDKFTLGALKDAIRKVKPDKNDVIVFAYSGHGFSFDNDAKHIFPQLLFWPNAHPHRKEIRANTINLEEVADMLRAKKARLNLVFSDCCNSFIGMERYIDPTMLLQGYLPTWNKSTCLKLFGKAKGSYIFAAAKKGQMANGNVSLGGFFTESFYHIMNMRLDKEITNDPQVEWLSILSDIGDEAKNLTASFGRNQDMIYKYVKN